MKQKLLVYGAAGKNETVLHDINPLDVQANSRPKRGARREKETCPLGFCWNKS